MEVALPAQSCFQMDVSVVILKQTSCQQHLRMKRKERRRNEKEDWLGGEGSVGGWDSVSVGAAGAVRWVSGLLAGAVCGSS